MNTEPTGGEMLGALLDYFDGDTELMNAHISNAWMDIGYNNLRMAAVHRLYMQCCKRVEHA